MTFSFFCPSCGRKISATTGLIDKFKRCPACQEKIQVPSPSRSQSEVSPSVHNPTSNKFSSKGEIRREESRAKVVRIANIHRKPPSNRASNFAYVFLALAISAFLLYEFKIKNSYHKEETYNAANDDLAPIDPGANIPVSASANTASPPPIFSSNDSTALGEITAFTTPPTRQTNAEINSMPDNLPWTVSKVPAETHKQDTPKAPEKTDNSYVPVIPPPKISHYSIEKSVKIKNNPLVASVTYGSCSVESNLHNHPQFRVEFAIPLDKKGKPSSSASNVVFFCPFTKQKDFFNSDQFKWYPENLGYTIFSFDLPGSSFEEIMDRDKMYYYPESGAHDLIFYVKRDLEAQYNLIEKNVLLVGESSGSILAKEMVLSNFHRIDAAAYHGGHDSLQLKAENANTAVLLMHTNGDIYSPAEDPEFLEIQILKTLPPPVWNDKGGYFFHHSASPTSWKLGQLFIEGIVRQRDKNNGVLPNYKSWEFSQPGKNGVNLYFPSKEFQDDWNSLPLGDLLDLRDKPIPAGKPFFINPAVSPKGVVLYLHHLKTDTRNDATLIDNLYFFSQHGMIAGSVMISDNHDQSIADVNDLVKMATSKAEWSDLPIHIIGLGTGGELSSYAGLHHGKRTNSNTFKKVSSIVAINSEYDQGEKPGGIKKARSQSNIPLTLIYSSTFEGAKAPKNTKYTLIKTIGEGDTLGSKWYSTLEAIIKGNKLAEN